MKYWSTCQTRDRNGTADVAVPCGQQKSTSVPTTRSARTRHKQPLWLMAVVRRASIAERILNSAGVGLLQIALSVGVQRILFENTVAGRENRNSKILRRGGGGEFKHFRRRNSGSLPQAIKHKTQHVVFFFSVMKNAVCCCVGGWYPIKNDK